jgi:large subunit ribosomal protein L23
MNPYDIIRRPRVTEKSVFLQGALGYYTFEVDTKANRAEIKDAVEKLFSVKVVSVKTMNSAGKRRRVGRSVGLTSDWKKALVKLADGQQIEGV